jgi:hypothetical protein
LIWFLNLVLCAWLIGLRSGMRGMRVSFIYNWWPFDDIFFSVDLTSLLDPIWLF